MSAVPMPPQLPNPLARYSFEAPSVSVTKLMDSSRVRQYPRSTKQPRKARIRWFLTDTQLEFFKLWYNIGLEAGTLKFSAKMAFGDSLQTNTARFLTDYQVFHDGHFEWRIEAEVEVEDPT